MRVHVYIRLSMQEEGSFNFITAFIAQLLFLSAEFIETFSDKDTKLCLKLRYVADHT